MSATKVKGSPALGFAPLLIVLLIVFMVYQNADKSPAKATASGSTSTAGKSPQPQPPGKSTPAPPPPAQHGGDARGVDISGNNGSIDWDTMAQHADFVYIKASEGTGWHDPLYTQYVQEADAHHIPHGAYHFFRPNAPVDEQVRTFLATMGPMRKGDLPPMVDLEFLDDQHKAEWLNLSMDQRARMVLDWLHQVECATGVTPVIYTSPSFARDVIGTQNYPEFAHYRLFVANWDTSSPWVPAPWKTWHMWQYTVARGVGYVQSHALDLDIVNGGSAGLAALRYDGRKSGC